MSLLHKFNDKWIYLMPLISVKFNNYYFLISSIYSLFFLVLFSFSLGFFFKKETMIYLLKENLLKVE